MAEALEDFPPSPDLTMRANAVRVIAGMYWITGTTRFPRGWVRPAMEAFVEAGLDCPNASVWRTYRSNVQENPGQFLSTPGVPRHILEQMELDALA